MGYEFKGQGIEIGKSKPIQVSTKPKGIIGGGTSLSRQNSKQSGGAPELKKENSKDAPSGTVIGGRNVNNSKTKPTFDKKWEVSMVYGTYCIDRMNNVFIIVLFVCYYYSW